VKPVVYVKPRRKDYPAAADRMHLVGNCNQVARKRLEIDAAPIMAERKRLEALRSRKGLVAAWTNEINRMEEDLKAMAYRLMDEIAAWFVTRPTAPRNSPAWSF
jgi:hypothetical protein